ncbi:MAG: N-acetyl sugar amidotransferase [Candidatus Nitrohelix vancouverensis]|uniref:N-acetyl sugar amidotransferase n=1 Tax=Candidatus Nitrohelix vancouverensis TaxID=2705534 RepID=A0A7T0C0D9_9BACT|nr:MAG: N-acetyl sugar amidotransferase [Candidatus Nitrohelix vancouverensis]
MEIIKKPQPVDFSEFAPDNSNPRTMWGLPQEIKYCKKCGYINQKPNSAQEYKHTRDIKKETLPFNEEGVCIACVHNASKHQSINWDEREKMLWEVCDRYRSKDGSYDCLVPGSGGKDSFYTAYELKYKFGMHPLTVTWAPHIYTDWGWDNLRAWIHSGFDNYLFNPNGKVHRLLTRLATENLFHPFQPFILGQFYFPVKMAMKFNIQLLFYGENAAEYGNSLDENSTALKSWKYLSTEDPSQVYLGGVSISDLKKDFGMTSGDIAPYMPPNLDELLEKKIEVHHLGYYLKWHPQSNYYFAVENSGFKAAPERTPGTYSKYAGIDDKIDDFNFYTLHVKFGIGRATYDASQEVRMGDIERDEAIALIRRYDGEYPERFAEEIFEYLSLPEKDFPIPSKMFESPLVDRAYFEALTNQFRSPHLWKYEDGQWRLRLSIWEQK